MKARFTSLTHIVIDPESHEEAILIQNFMRLAANRKLAISAVYGSGGTRFIDGGAQDIILDLLDEPK